MLLSTLRGVGTLPTVICLEVSQLLIYSLKRSAELSPKLYDSFLDDAGYDVITDNLTWLSNNGSRDQIVRRHIPGRVSA